MISQRENIKKATISLIFIYLLYTFWYQYAFSPIDGFLSILGILMLMLSITTIHTDISYYKEIVVIVIFIIYCFLTGLITSNNPNMTMKLVLQIVKYCIPLYTIYLYVGQEEKKLDDVMLSMLLGCSVLAIWSFYNPIYTMTYTAVAITGEGKLNPNVFSSYMMLGVMGCTYFLRKEEGIRKYILYILLVVILISQLRAASRRGILVCVLIVFAYFHTFLTIKNGKSKFKKIATIILLIIIIAALLSEFTKLTDSFVVLQRLQGLYIGGDNARRYYQEIAFELFESSPLFGKGLGAVTNEIGMYSHSLYFELLACTGLVGTTIMLGYLISIIWRFGKASIKRSYDYNLFFSRLMFWYGFALLVSGVAVVLIYDSYFYIILSIFACSLKIINNKNRNSRFIAKE